MLPDKIDRPLYSTVKDYMEHKKNTRTFYLIKSDTERALYLEFPDTEGLGEWEPSDDEE
jgi:hypothetical protein